MQKQMKHFLSVRKHIVQEFLYGNSLSEVCGREDSTIDSMQTGRVKFISMCLQIRICLAKRRVMSQSTTIWFRIWFQIDEKDSDSESKLVPILVTCMVTEPFFLRAYPLLNHRYRGTITIQSQLFTSRE